MPFIVADGFPHAGFEDGIACEAENADRAAALGDLNRIGLPVEGIHGVCRKEDVDEALRKFNSGIDRVFSLIHRGLCHVEIVGALVGDAQDPVIHDPVAHDRFEFAQVGIEIVFQKPRRAFRKSWSGL